MKVATSKKIFSILLLLIGGGFFFDTQAQEHSCGTDHFHDEWKKTIPNWEEIEKKELSIPTSSATERRTGKRIIPVVFHVLHTNGSENISNEQILDQMRILNEDFNKQNADVANVRNTSNAPFAPLVTDMEIEFVLAKKDPQGNCTNGINRIYSPLHVDAGNNVKNLVKWPVNRYFNIWIVSSIEGSTSTGTILGFANFPWMSATTDGVVMRSDEIGSIGTGHRGRAGRTLTHEVGHYLGLMHTFQGGCGGQGDGVADTPPVATSESNRNCNPSTKSCSNSTLLDQWENYMDYSLGCQYMFTHGQKARVDHYLSDERKQLVSQENLEFTGVLSSANKKPMAYFESDVQTVCAGEPVQFFDNSCQGVVNQRTWEFQGANIQSSSQPSPVVTFENPGEYSVKLTTSNSFGSSTYEAERYIKVLPRIADMNGIEESFESEDMFSAAGISQMGGMGFGKFEKATTGYFGNTSIKAPVTFSNTGTRFILELPPLNLSNYSDSDPRLSFMVAHARRTTTNNDVLRIYISDDCGNTWQQRMQRVSGQLASVQGLVNNFAPTDQSHWMRVTLNLYEYRNATNVKIRIEVQSGGGNPVYIDDINIGRYFTSVPSVERVIDAEIYPNPSNSTFNIKLSAAQQNIQTQVDVFDISGRKITTLLDGKIQQSSTDILFDPKEYNLNSGIYFLKIETNEGILTKKLIFAN